MALVLLHQFSDSIEASVARSHLLSQGIRTFIFGDENEWNTSYRTIPVRLMVTEEEYEAAAEILSGFEAPRASGAD